MIKVMLVDDHKLVRLGIQRVLEDASGIQVVGEAGSGEEALALSRECKPDVVLMDIKMPGIGGFEATRKLARSNPKLKILIVTVCKNDIYPSRLLQVGASGYITKGASVKEMVTAIHNVYEGKQYISPEIASNLAFRHAPTNIDKEVGKPFDALSERELQVMIMISDGRRVQDIARELNLSPKTVNSYRYRIFEKLKVNNDVEMTLLAIQHGLIESEEDARRAIEASLKAEVIPFPKPKNDLDLDASNDTDSEGQ